MRFKNQTTIFFADIGTKFGWSRSICTLRPELHINVIDHGTIFLDNLATEKMKGDFNNIFTRNRYRLMILEEQLLKIFNTNKIDCFAAEDIFANPQRISSFRALSLYTETLERIVNINQNQKLHRVAATTIKRHISSFGHADKSQVQQSILDNSCITMKNIDKATEHEYDSIAGCYAFIKEYLLTTI